MYIDTISSMTAISIHIKQTINADFHTYLETAWKDQATEYRTLCKDVHLYMSLLPRDIQNLIYPLTLTINETISTDKVTVDTNYLGCLHGIRIKMKVLNVPWRSDSDLDCSKSIKTIQNSQVTGPFTEYINDELITEGNLVNNQYHGTITHIARPWKHHTVHYANGTRQGPRSYVHLVRI